VIEVILEHYVGSADLTQDFARLIGGSQEIPRRGGRIQRLDDMGVLFRSGEARGPGQVLDEAGGAGGWIIILLGIPDMT
jgi:hypothetical protein